jgi:hypothetical protein
MCFHLKASNIVAFNITPVQQMVAAAAYTDAWPGALTSLPFRHTDPEEGGIRPAQQIEHRGLAAAGWPDDSDKFPSRMVMFSVSIASVSAWGS